MLLSNLRAAILNRLVPPQPAGPVCRIETVPVRVDGVPTADRPPLRLPAHLNNNDSMAESGGAPHRDQLMLAVVRF
jgi:hypothetical protein